MSEETDKEIEETKQVTDAVPAEDTPESRAKAYEVTIKKSTGELVIKDSKSGQSIVLRGRLNETDGDQEEEPKSLTAHELRTALQRVDGLGLTWTADLVPRIKPKQSTTDEVFAGEEFEKIPQDYPNLPSELSALVFYILTGREPSASVASSPEELEAKSGIVQELLVTPAYRTEFFFKHSIKVPYLEDIDWEVVLKLSERNVKPSPSIPYALLALGLRDPSSGNLFFEMQQRHKTVTVAVDENLINHLISILIEVKTSLESARNWKEKGDGTATKDD